LPERVEERLDQITPELMERVYEHWIERLTQVIGPLASKIDITE
jgi:hypothetical protein